jgi:succinoglycan biosynthesis transport protein ExoP
VGRGLGVGDDERVRLTDSLYKTQSQLAELSAAGTVSKSQIAFFEKREEELVQRITELDRKFVREQIAAAKDLWDDAKAQEQKLTKVRDDEFARLQDASGKGSEYELRKTECQMLESQYNIVLDKIHSLDLNARLGGLGMQVLEKAVAATEPFSPQMARVMGIGVLSGLMLGVVLSLVRDWRDQRVRSADEIAAILGVPMLGTVPSIPRRALSAHQGDLRLAPNARESEAYRAIRTSLCFGVPHDKSGTILVTSPGPLEGKTTVVSNLGIAMARAGQRTLIVDADMRKPMQCRVFGMRRHGPGLSDVVVGTTALEQTIQPTDIQGLDVLTSGESTPDTSELLQSQKLVDVLEQLKGKYDRILIDSPPIGVVTDAQILAALCDLTLLVLRANRSMRQTTQRAREALLAVGARVGGAIVNDVPSRDRRYGYSHYDVHYESNGNNIAPKELPANIGPRPGNDNAAPKKTLLEEAINTILRDQS